MISVLIPAYNAAKTIHRCLDSVLGQTIKDLEIIIVNDGSKDDTLQILQSYALKDKRIIVIDQPNSGVAAARNAVLRRAQGEFILYIDADDWIEPVMLERLLYLSEGADIVMCSSDHAEKPDDVLCADKQELESWNHERQLYEFMQHKRLTGMLWNKLVRRSITDGCTFNVKTGYGEDAEFLWQVLKNSQNMILTNEILYHHTMEKSSISHLSFSDKKYSAIPMWEQINKEVEQSYPELAVLAKERLTSAAVFSLYEIKKCGYSDKKKIRHMRRIARRNCFLFIKSHNVSLKFKLYAMAVCMGY